MKLKRLTFIIAITVFALLLISCSSSENNKTDIITDFETEDNMKTEITPENTSPETEATESATENTETTTPETELPSTNEPKIEVLNHSNMKAMWLSQFDLQSIYSSNNSQRNKEDFTARIKTVLSNVKNNGFNTVILQVRPYADSFYPSELFPPSKYVTGSYGNGFDYDPIDIIITEAHGIELSIQAWINPLRGMTVEEMKLINDKYAVKQWSTTHNGTYIVEVSGRYYLNPAYPETRQLIVDGVDEILQKYAFDGVHMDDYFYPTTADSFDSQAYNEYVSSGGTLSLKNYRSQNINLLVSEIYSTVKSHNNELLYGISPEGNINNATDKAYADVYTWCSEKGYIDYICPQIYFGLEHQSWAFDKTAQIWSDIIKNNDIKLIIGMTFGKALSKTDKWAGSGKDEWANNNDVMKRCLSYSLELDKCSGVSVFCYQYYYEPLSGTEVTETKTERDQFTELLKESVWKKLLK